MAGRASAVAPGGSGNASPCQCSAVTQAAAANDLGLVNYLAGTDSTSSSG